MREAKGREGVAGSYRKLGDGVVVLFTIVVPNRFIVSSHV